MATEVDNYLCLLDNVSLKDSPLNLGNYVVEKIDPEALAEFLYCRPFKSLPVLDQQRVAHYSMWPWAKLNKPVEQSKTDEDSENWERLLRQHELTFHHAGEQSYWPFDWLVRTLNLLKSSDGPVMPIQYYHVTPEAREGKAEVKSIILGEPTANGDEEGNQWPYLLGFELSQTDAKGYQDLEFKLRQALRKECAKNSVSNGHIQIAVEYFERGNRAMRSILDPIFPLLFYEFALEGLYVQNRNEGSKRTLERRIPAAIDAEQTVEVERLCEFIGAVFCIRSKAAHGVCPVAELERRIRQVDTSGLFSNGGPFCRSLVNLREIVRRSIRFFIDKYVEGVKRHDVLSQLDGSAREQSRLGC